MELKRVVTGMGLNLLVTQYDYWAALKSGKSGAAKITQFDASLLKLTCMN